MKELIAKIFGFDKALEAAEKRADQFEDIISQCIDAAITIDEHNTVTLYNKAAETLWGYKASEVIGQNVKMLVPAAIRGDHDNLVNANRTTGIDKIVGTFREVEIERKDGSKAWGSLALSRIIVEDKMHYAAFVRNITEEKDNRDVIAQTYEQSINGIITIDQNNNVIMFNKAAEELWGYDREEVLGQNVKMLVPSEIRANHDNLVNANRTTGVNKIVGTSRDIEIERKDGKRTWANLSLSRVQVGDKIQYTAFVRDITEEKKLRDFNEQVLEQAIDAVVSINQDNIVTGANNLVHASCPIGIN